MDLSDPELQLPPKVEHHRSGFTVSVRVKPLDTDCSDEYAVSNPSTGCIQLNKSFGDSKVFSYDFVHWSTGNASIDKDCFASQETVFRDMGVPIVENAKSGFNCTLFAYGQTGSGKTHTMIGSGDEGEGLIPRICRHLLGAAASIEHVVSCKYEVSYVEIYMEKVKDLLDTKADSHSTSLRVREHPETGPFVEGCHVEAIKSYDGIKRLMAVGNKKRRTASTDMNEHSSRSHAIFILTLTQERVLPGGNKYIVVSKVNLVDLAGSENAGQAGSTGEQLKEGASINKSLLTLGRVIKALAERSDRGRPTLDRRRSSLQPSDPPARKPEAGRSTTPPPLSSRNESMIEGGTTVSRRSSAASAAAFASRPLRRGESMGGVSGAAAPLAPPYRDSVLTYLLRDSLGGNSKTTLVAAIRPGVAYQEETAMTLSYASQARSIVNVVHVNENPFVAAIKTLQKQVEELRRNLEIANGIIAATSQIPRVEGRSDAALPDSPDADSSVQLAPWLMEEDENSGADPTQSPSSHQHEAGRRNTNTSAALEDILEGPEDGEEDLSDEDVADAVIAVDTRSEHSTDSGDSSEADIDEYKSNIAYLADANSSNHKAASTNQLVTDNSLLSFQFSGSDGGIAVLPSISSDESSPNQMVNVTPPVTTPGRGSFGQTWMSVSSVHGEEAAAAASPISMFRVPPAGHTTPKTSFNELEPVEKCGFLLKRGFINTSYKLRYFKTDYDQLVFYKRNSDAKPRGLIKCSGASVDKRHGDPYDPTIPFAFTLRTPKDTNHPQWILQATSERERDDWILIINTMAALPPRLGNNLNSPIPIESFNATGTALAVGKAACCVS